MTTYKIALRHKTREILYQTYRLCQEGRRLPADFGTTIEELHFLARDYRLWQVRGYLEQIDRLQNGRATHELLDTIEEYMREFSISFAEVDTSEAAFKNLRERCKPRTSALVALHARAGDTAMHPRHPHPR